MLVINEPMELGMWNLVQKQNIAIPINFIWNTVYKSTITYKATVQNF